MRGVVHMRALGAVACALAVTATFAGSTAAAPTDGGPEGRVEPKDRSGPSVPYVQTPAQAGTVSASTSVVNPSQPCPTGTSVGRTIHVQGFESGIPEPAFNQGWSSVTGGAAVGTRHAQSSLPDPSNDDYHFFYLDPITTSAGARTFISATSRGQWADDTLELWANNYYTQIPPSADWARGWVEMTLAVQESGGYLDVSFDHLGDPANPVSSEANIDDVRVYTCVPTPASGVRGDWTGEGTVDVLGTLADGSLYLYPGTGTGRLGSGQLIGSGWNGMTWVGSPGDVDGDRRTDLLARKADGTVWFYRGRGAGTFGSAVQFGSGWNGMTAIATPGDLDGDGALDLLARRSDGTLHLYRLTAVGGRYTGQVGNGWNGMTWIVGMGDLNGDRRGDVVAVRDDGLLFGYSGSSTGLRNLGQIGSGWGAMTFVASPGDMNRDGRGDLLGRRSDGTLWFYAGTSAGVGSGQQIGSGWTGMQRIL